MSCFIGTKSRSENVYWIVAFEQIVPSELRIVTACISRMPFISVTCAGMKLSSSFTDFLDGSH